MKTVSKLFEAMLTKETTPVWGGRAATRVDGPTGMFTCCLLYTSPSPRD